MLFSDTYRTIQLPGLGVYKDRGSRFLGFVFHVTSENQVKEHLGLLKKEYYDARHHCYAYILGPDKAAYRINDDGEPSGSAGRPIYNILLSNDLTNILIVVIRYFGGIKLGVPGLIKAYKTAAIEALNNTLIVEKIVFEAYKISYSYEFMNEIMKIIKDQSLTIITSDFNLDCTIDILIRKKDSDHILESLKKISGVKATFLYMI
ncbi:MAG: YigZ family protein [Bacteroidetes bacterium GWE2_42_24]|nr:MAG: YigZ family protein [Bacteroidetes bacterium GWE2_42_24]OFY32296.1 MAG: YigZ family protein [Bacteroidetes bacterium GWF2_43_11]PKP23597.1 MAG: YigZ family protein [Bacteroidetes bacterium HGW-Bacteroidetes-22]